MRRLIILVSFFSVHLFITILVFLYGMVFGAGDVPVMSPTGGGQGASHGIAGGTNAIGNLLILYVFTLGIVPLAISVISAAIAWAATRNLAKQRVKKIEQEQKEQRDIEGPRLSIAYLLLWTMFCAIGLGVARIRTSSMPLVEDGPIQSYAGIFILLTGITLGTSSTALLLWGYWSYRKLPFPRYEGEVFLCALALSAIMRSLTMSILSIVFAGLSGWLAPLGELPAALIVWGSIVFVRSPRWSIVLLLFGLYLVTGGFVLLAPFVLGALVVTAILDWRQAKSYPWTHWFGVAMGLWVLLSYSAFKVYSFFVLS